jgi:hypothetical protein
LLVSVLSVFEILLAELVFMGELLDDDGGERDFGVAVREREWDMLVALRESVDLAERATERRLEVSLSGGFVALSRGVDVGPGDGWVGERPLGMVWRVSVEEREFEFEVEKEEARETRDDVGRERSSGVDGDGIVSSGV